MDRRLFMTAIRGGVKRLNVLPRHFARIDFESAWLSSIHAANSRRTRAFDKLIEKVLALYNNEINIFQHRIVQQAVEMASRE